MRDELFAELLFWPQTAIPGIWGKLTACDQRSRSRNEEERAMVFAVGLSPEAFGGEGKRTCVSNVVDHPKNVAHAKHSGLEPKELDYSVQIGDGPIVRASADSGFEYPLLQSPLRQLVKIRHKGEIVESFWMDFEKLDDSEYCLWFRSLYHTWSYWPLRESRHLCDCDS